MKAYYEDAAVELYHGDCLDILADLPDNSVDSVVTDPPYGLGFMGREWDDLPPGVEFASECLRVLKPGGHMVAFGGSRTWHRLATAVEDAGFEIRDSIAWLYGSGFPKSLDVSKAIDKAAGAEREVVGDGLGLPGYHLNGHKGGEAFGHGIASSTPETRLAAATITAPATPDAERWQGWGTALKPAFEPIVVGRKPLAGTVAAIVLAHGTGALNIDGCRVGDDERVNGPSGAPGANNYRLQGGDGRDVKNARRYAEASKALPPTTVTGRWPTNVVLDESQADELDAQSGTTTSVANVRKRAGTSAGNGETLNRYAINQDNEGGYADSGGASRFFPTFHYEAKAPSHERPTYQREGEEQWLASKLRKRCVTCGKQEVNMPGSACSCAEPDFQPDPSMVGKVAHPTVKPLDLMRWLVRLVTPPGGTVLDPFAGSGTTAEACVIEHFRCITIEREPDYLPLIVARLTKPIQVGLDFEGLGA